MDLCWFIPGKVIDEIFSVLRCIQDEETPPRAYEILQELRDITSMAMEQVRIFSNKSVLGSSI
jgi:F-box protein 28